MSEAILKLRSTVYRFGGKLQTSKLILLCVRLFSRESLYQPPSSSQALYYGQTPQPKSRTTGKESHVPRDIQGSQTALTKTIGSEKKPNSNRNKHKIPDFHSLRVKLSNSLFLLWSDKRLRTGMIFVLILAPASKFLYLLMPVKGFGDYLINTNYLVVENFIEVEGWYYFSLYYFLYAMGNLVNPLLTVVGVFLLFPKNYYPSYLAGVPFGYYLARVIGHIQAVDLQSFHDVAFGTALMYTIFGVILFAVSDKMLFNDNHRKRAIEARIIGLINMPGMDWKDKEELLKKEAKDATKEKNNELFNRAG